MIDDDAELLDLARTWLGNAGYELVMAGDGAEGLRRAYSSRPNLVLLDVRLPSMDGWEVCRRIREMCDVPIIMISVNGARIDVLKGFSLGADDYVSKPFDFRELVARVQAVLRRSGTERGQEARPAFRSEEIAVDWRSHQVHVRGEQVSLTPTEFRMLACLIENQGWVVTHEQLLRKAWGPNYLGDRSYVKVYIRYLRQKIERDANEPRLILTERGVGYRFPSIDTSHTGAARTRGE
jgi:DNA-binding response OmpR family regulator